MTAQERIMELLNGATPERVGQLYAQALRTQTVARWTEQRDDRATPATITVTPQGRVSGTNIPERDVTAEERSVAGAIDARNTDVRPLVMPPQTPWERRRLGFSVGVDTLGDAVLSTSILACGWIGYVVGEKTGRMFQGAIAGLALGVLVGRSAERMVVAKLSARGATPAMPADAADVRAAAAADEARRLAVSPFYGGRFGTGETVVAGDGRGPGSEAVIRDTPTQQLVQRSAKIMPLRRG